MIRVIRKTNWDESLHPRESDGTFAGGGPRDANGIPSNAHVAHIVDAMDQDVERSRDQLQGWLADLERVAAMSETGGGGRLNNAIAKIERLLGRKPSRSDGYAYGLDSSSDSRPRATKTPPGAHGVYK
jgi:hypothetical protein